MDTTTHKLIQAIHNSQNQIVLATAGAGSQALTNLLNVAGASRTLLEAIVPYSEASFTDFLGQSPEQYVARETACLMAGRAYTRARWLQSKNSAVTGLACTATIVTDRPKRGEHRAFIAAWQPEKLKCLSIHLEKGARDRAGEEDLVSRLILNLLAETCNLDLKLPISLSNGDTLAKTVYDFTSQVQALLKKEIPFFSIRENGRFPSIPIIPNLLLSGSFNPLHEGHLEMAQAATKLLGKPVAFELSAANADKPPLPKKTVLHRLAQFAGRHVVYASTSPTFVKKSRIYPGTTFIVGYDTAQRIIQPRFYDGDHSSMLKALSEIRGQGCSFLVAGRIDDNGSYLKPSDLLIPQGYQDLFAHLHFRKDISSTELRNTTQKGSR